MQAVRSGVDASAPILALKRLTRSVEQSGNSPGHRLFPSCVMCRVRRAARQGWVWRFDLSVTDGRLNDDLAGPEQSGAVFPFWVGLVR